MVFSYATRSRPPGWIKFLVAVAAIAASVWFVHAVSAPVSDITNVEEPLTVLLCRILVVHSFHVPSRRDLMFSLAASAGLMAVGGAQAIDLTFGLYVLAWAWFGLCGLVLMWRSASGGGRISAGSLGAVLAGVTAAAAAVFLVLPAPTVAAKLSLFARAGSGGSIGVPGALAGDSGSPSQLARPGSPTGATRVGGYLGFANSLDTALRGSLSNTLGHAGARPAPVVLGRRNVQHLERHRAGRSTKTPPTRSASNRPSFCPTSGRRTPPANRTCRPSTCQASTANLVFHAQSASELWFPTSRVFSLDGRDDRVADRARARAPSIRWSPKSRPYAPASCETPPR